MGRWLSLTSIKLSPLPPITLQTGDYRFLLYKVIAKNTGANIALNCWPQLVNYPKELGIAFTPQPMPWNYEVGEQTSGQFTKKSLQRKDEVGFTVIFTSEWDSKNGVYLADIPTARRDKEHDLVGLPLGIHIIKVNLIGDNVRVKPLILRITLADLYTDSWQTLKVERWRKRQVIMHKIRKILKFIMNLRQQHKHIV